MALVAGCATTTPPPAPTTAPPPAELAAYLPDPTVGYPDADPGLVATRDAHARLLRTGDARAAQQSLANLLAERPDLGPARVALAQALLVAGESGRAVDAARAAAPDGVARELVLGRALEASGDPAAAAIVFAKAQERSPVARSATDRLRTRASNLLAERAQEATARGRYAEAEGIVADLALLQPTARRTLELRLGLAGASGDRRLELDLLRDLTAEPGASREQRLRRADLELEIGDAAAGLAIVQTLASASPGDPDLAEHLRRAQFRWRIVNSPESVRVAASQAQLTRAEGAVLLYWCLPRVRTGAAGEARIASDILDHPAREEIVRVVNLGLLTVDDTLHTFGPDRPLRRSELLGALMRVLDRSAPGARCGGGATNACERAAACGLVPSAGDCLASGYLSGAEALEMIRRATERLEGP
ncbi:MAG: hypothetical protein H6511_04490 [Holophagales bacterium]|nr:hypothetical protein [Holophagales bacterium]